MERVLITGATSSQYSVEAHRRSARFAGLLNSALNFDGIQTELKSLPVEDSGAVSQYSTVLVGLAPVSSMSSNKLYPSLTTLAAAFKQGNAKVFIDAPDPSAIFQSYKSVLKSPEILTKDLYSTRDGYQSVVSSRSTADSILETIEHLLSGDYDILYPSIPYYDQTRDVYGIPSGSGSFVGLNFDSLFSDNLHLSTRSKPRYWLSESISTKWSKQVSKTVSKPVLPVRRNAYDTECDYISRMQNSFGYLNGAYKNGTLWWSPNIMLALSCGVPVFSDWTHTISLGESWSMLPHNSEDMSNEERCSLALAQRASYLASVDNWTDAAGAVAKTVLTKN